MSIKITALILAIAVTLVITPVLIVPAPQLAYAQQGPSTNSNFQEIIHQSPPKYSVKIPTNWEKGQYPNIDRWFQSPDKSQYVSISRRLPGLDSLQDWVNWELRDMASKGKTLLRDDTVKWQGIHPTRILMYPDHISIWIEAYTRIFNIAAYGAVINDQTITEILNSFQIQVPTALEHQQIANENNNFYCTALGGISSTHRCVY